MGIREIPLDQLNEEAFIEQKVKEIASAVGDGLAINALSGGVDSAAVTMLGYRALGDRLKTVFVDHGLMREGEPRHIVSLFENLGVHVDCVDGRDAFFGRLRGLTDPEEKRDAVTQAFYKDVFVKLVKESGATCLLHGTNYTDVEETVAGIKRQHNILTQLGIDPLQAYGYTVLEPIIELRKTGVRRVARALGLPEELYSRPPFPGPALAARIIGEVTPERVAIVRAATKIVEDELDGCGAFQYLAVLHEERVTGIRNGKREFGLQIEVRCWDSTDAVTATPTRLEFDTLRTLGDRIGGEVPGVVSVTYNISCKPPSTIEVI